jgi:hypothetical protein
MENSLVFLRRALWLVCLSVIAASIAIMESSNSSFATAVSDEHAVHMEGDLCASHSVRVGIVVTSHMPHCLHAGPPTCE